MQRLLPGACEDEEVYTTQNTVLTLKVCTADDVEKYLEEINHMRNFVRVKFAAKTKASTSIGDLFYSLHLHEEDLAETSQEMINTFKTK